MWNKNWRQREQNARDKIVARQEQLADPEFQARRAAQQQLIFDAEERARAERERERFEHEGPAREVAEVMIERLGFYLPEILSVFAKPGGKARVMALLEQAAARETAARREDARVAEAESMAELSASMAERAAARREADAERRAASRAAEREARSTAPETSETA